MAYTKEVSCGQITLNNSKFETNLAYNSSTSYMYIEKYIYRKSEEKDVSTGRLDFATAEAMSIITLLVETSNTGKPAEHIYPSGTTKFSASSSDNYITLEKYYRKNRIYDWRKHDNSIKIHLNEMPAVILKLHQTLVISNMISW